jgi:N-acetylglucosaminyldiphosphoundecaprenol N-acetyl-beta-D-mannosaminyltransferase
MNYSEEKMEASRVANFLGIGIDPMTYEAMFARIEEWLRNKESRSHHIACINTYCITLALNDARLARIYNGADIVGADGVPFVWWIRRFLKASCDRLAAPDILLQLAQRAEQTGYTFYLYGGAPDVLENMTGYLKERFPYIKIVGAMSPPFRPLTREEDQAITDQINRLQPDIVCVGLGTPKQDYWIEDHLYAIRGAVLIASGATFDFFGGRIKMAPEWIRKSGFEWLYRLLSKDFLRLWKRYTLMNIVFLWNFLLQLLNARVRPLHRWTRPDINVQSSPV